MSKNLSPSVAWRLTLAAAMAVLMTACGSDSKPVGTIGHVKGFAGAVAGDEPAAVLAARDVLSAGGNAVDAAVTLYFSLAVTLPSTASLGGGGSCVVHDTKRKSTEVLDFRAPPVARQGELAMAVPANARGFFALSARYGKMRWESLLAEPERMARGGVPVSRALANDLAIAAPLLAADPEAQRLFFRPDGRVLAEGDRLQNLDLATVLSSLRRAPGEFYVGQLSRELAASAQQAGGGLAMEDLRDLRPQFSAGATIAIGDDIAVLPVSRGDGSRGDGARGDGGTILTAMAHRRAAERPQFVADRVGEAAAQQGANGFRGNPPGTGFVIVDSFGTSVACGVSANGLFGTGRVAPGKGIVLAAVPVGDAVGAAPALLYNKNNQEMHFVGVAGGGGSPAAASAAALLAVADEGSDVEHAVAKSVAGPLASRINAATCEGGTPSAAKCAVATDPRGFGYAVVVGRE